MAKKPLTKVNKAFVEKRAKQVTDLDVEKVVKKSNAIRKKFSLGPLKNLIDDGKLLLSLVKDYWNKEYRQVPYWVVASAVVALIYVLSPVDLVPDFIPIIGYVDDAAVVSLCLTMIRKELAQYKEWKHG